MEIKPDVYPQMGAGQGAASVEAGSGLASLKRGGPCRFTRPESVQDWRVADGELRLLLRSGAYENRLVYTHETSMHQFRRIGDAPPLELRINFFTEDIFRVRLCVPGDFLDVPEDQLPPTARMLMGSPVPVETTSSEDQQSIHFATARVALEIRRENPRIVARDERGAIFFEQKRTDLFTADVFDLSLAEDDAFGAAFESLALSPGEAVYGLGERFDHVERTGKAVDFWNKDAIGTSSPRTYINVPFLMTSRGYGLFLNQSVETQWEIGTLDGCTLGFGALDGRLDYFVMYGPTPREILKKYCDLTGAPGLPPVWSFGLWMSRNSYMSWDIVNEVAVGLRAREIPADVLHLDTAWFTEDWNCDLRFSKERFPDPERHMAALRERGFRVCLWQYNFIPPKGNNINYREALEKGYFVLDAKGDPLPCGGGHQGSWTDDLVIDFTNPEAAAWYGGQIGELIRMGAASIKTDFGEGVPADGVYLGAEGRKMHNLYSLVYNDAVFRAIKEAGGDGVLWARSGTAGSQRYPVHWGGDSQCSWAGLTGTVRAALSMGLSGFPFFSHDVGGFIGRPDPELYIRWAQFGFLSSHTRCHGAGNENSREPWTFGPDAERIFRRYANLRYALMPYIYGQAMRCAEDCVPMVRALFIEHPSDRNVYAIDDEYYFGDDLLVAPILQPMDCATTRSVYLPRGVWYDYFTRRRFDSAGEWIEVEVALDDLPIFVRQGAALPYTGPRPSTRGEVGRVIRVELYGSVYDGDFYTGQERIHIRGGEARAEDGRRILTENVILIRD